MPNPYVLLGIAAVWLASLFGVYHFGHSTATTYEKAQCAKAAKVVADQAIVARNQSDAEKKTLQDYATLLGRNYYSNQALAAKTAANLLNRTQAHVEQNPIAVDHKCDLPDQLLRDINDAGGNSEGTESQPGVVVDAGVPLAAAHPH